MCVLVIEGKREGQIGNFRGNISGNEKAKKKSSGEAKKDIFGVSLLS